MNWKQFRHAFNVKIPSNRNDYSASYKERNIKEVKQLILIQDEFLDELNDALKKWEDTDTRPRFSPHCCKSNSCNGINRAKISASEQIADELTLCEDDLIMLKAAKLESKYKNEPDVLRAIRNITLRKGEWSRFGSRFGEASRTRSTKRYKNIARAERDRAFRNSAKGRK